MASVPARGCPPGRDCRLRPLSDVRGGGTARRGAGRLRGSRLSSSSGSHVGAAGDVDRLTRDRRARAGGQEEDGLGDLDRLDRAPEGNLRLELGEMLLRQHPLQERIRDQSGRDAVDPHTVLRDLLGGRPRQCQHAGLCGVVGGVARRAAGPGLDRGDVDDRAGAALDHLRQHRAHGQEVAGQADVDHAAPRFRRRLPDGRGLGGPGVVDEHVDAAHLISDLAEHGCDAVLVADVQLPPASGATALTRDLLRHALRPGEVEVRDRDVGAGLGEQPSGRLSDSRPGGRGDERHPAVEGIFEPHSLYTAA